MVLAANVFARTAAVVRGETFDSSVPDFPTGVQRARAEWRRAVTAEARAVGVRLPPFRAERVGT